MMTFAKSLRGTREAGGLYRAGQDNLVPDFTRGGPRLVQIAEEPSLDGAGRTRMKGVVAELEKGKPMSEQALESGKVPAARVVPAGSGGRWIGNPFAPRATLRADAKGQLTLEFVKVVRNDLSDADLELAPARPKTPAPVPPAPLAGAGRGAAPEPLEPEPSRWSRFTARLFGNAVTHG